MFAQIGDVPVIYADVPLDAWYTPYVSFLIGEGVAQGYKDATGKPTGEFGVEKPIT